MQISRFISLVSALLLMSAGLVAQTATGAFVGVITDQTGAVVSGATIVVTNRGTNRSVTVVSNESGAYVAPLLNPGEYDFAVTKTGFKKAIRGAVTLQVEQRAAVDFTLSSGDISETVEVQATAPLLETGSSSLGQVINNEKIVGLPLNARGVFNLVALSPGVIPNQDNFFVQQADSSINPSLFKANGGRSLTNEVLVDGVPNNGGSFGQIALHPTVDAVQEFKVQTNNYSAEFGNSGGAIVNVSIKSGTNKLHGTLWEFLRNDALDANNFFANRANRRKGKFRFNQYGGTVGGPIWIPKIYDGHDKSFFFFSYEGVRRITGIDPVFLTVPTEAQRRGDFSNLRDANGNVIPIFDPLTTTTNASGQFIRTQFPGNIIPENRISATAKALLALTPLPNTTPTNAFTQANNFITQEPNRLKQYQVNNRGDHTFSQANTISFRYSKNRSDNAPANLFGNDAAPNFGALTFVAHNAMLQDVHTFSPTLLLTLRGGLSRFATDRKSPGSGDPVNMSALGLPNNLPNLAFPRFDIAGYTSIGTPTGNFIRRAVNIYTFQSSLNKITGNHDLKIGGEFRVQHQNTFQPSALSGQFSFTQGFLSGPVVGQNNTGDGLAALLLGFPASSTLSNDAAVAESRPYLAFYIQDNYKLSRKLTFNLGLRYDLHLPRTDRFDRLLNFDPTATEPTTGRLGAFRFVGRNTDNRGQFDTDKSNFGPRVGFAYQVNDRTVMRGGAALGFISPFNEGDTIAGLGLSPTFSTRGVNTQASTTAPTITIANPFPAGLVAPLADSQGLASLVGDSATFVGRNYPIAEFFNWNLGVQREFRSDLVVEIAYAGSKGNKLAGPSIDLNTLRPENLALGDGLRAQVANPFFGKIRTGPLSTATVERQLLLRDYPQFVSVGQQGIHDYFSNYHSFLLSVQKRLAAGFSISGAYTLSKLIDNAPGNGEAGGSIQNVYNRAGEKSVSGEDIPQRLVVNYLYELPFGHGKKYLGSGALAVILGGWEFSGIGTFSKERPLGITATGGSFLPGARRPNLVGDPNLPDNERTFLRWFNTSAFAFPATAFALGNVSRTQPNTRRPGFQIWDLSLQKNTPLKEGVSLEFRAEFFNAFNKTNFLGPNTQLGNAAFGQITAARTPRQIQFALKLIY
ncbi:MAG: TonB-dependent receptor [Acidobacteria bacterium]|nr:TonB-dependent receptor [Acidobacteriota bacterium]